MTGCKLMFDVELDELMDVGYVAVCGLSVCV